MCAVFNRSSIYFWLSSFFDITKVPNAYETKRKSHNNNGGDQENVTGILPYNVMQTIFSSRLANVWMKNFNDALDLLSPPLARGQGLTWRKRRRRAASPRKATWLTQTYEPSWKPNAQSAEWGCQPCQGLKQQN